MTLLASERSLLIRNKFRSVLQLRIQNRRQQNEINSDAGVKSTCLSLLGEKERSEAVCLPEDSAAHKSPPSGFSGKPVNCTTQDWSDGAGQQQKRARLAEDLSEKIQRRPGPLELLQKHILPLETAPISFLPSSDVSEDDISCSSSSSSPEQLGIHQSPVFSASPGLTGDHSLSDLSPGPTPLSQSPNNFQCSLAMLPATEGISQPMTMTLFDSDSMASPGRTKGILLTTQVTRLPPQTAQPPKTPPQSNLAPSASPSRPPRCKKPRDSKPKMKKLKYHQYIPPDQRGGAGGGTSGGSAQRGSTPVPPIDPAYSRLLQQQQVFLQLQILNQQQQQQKQQQGLTVPPSGDPQKVRFTGASQPTCTQGSPKGTNSTPTDTNPNHKPELLPPNLDDLTVSELRQHLRKRGLPVSGTKPSLLDRLRPYQLPRPCLPPAPLCQLGSNMVAPAPTVLSNAHPDSPSNPPNIFIQSSNMLSKAGANGGDQAKTGVGFLTGTSSRATSLHPPSSHPLSSGTPWRPGQAAEEMSVEMEMRERLRSRPRERAHKVGSDVAGDSSGPLHPFLQQDTGCQRVNSDTNGQPEVLFTQVFSCQPCDVIGQDFELPMQITASPAQVPSSGRSLEEELQEAIQRVQMAPSQSIEDILDEPLTCADTVSSVSELQAAVAALSGPSPSPLVDQPQQPSLHPSKDENFLSSPLCSSLLLELPPSPSNVPQLAPPPPPPPPPICTTPPATAVSRKRREAATFDPADWLESLTSCLRPLTPPAAPFVETDFGLDSDLNVNRVLDLIVEQW